MTDRHINIGVEICAALGADANRATSVDFHFGVGNIATVTITRHITKAEALALVDAIKHYNIVPKPEIKRLPLLTASDAAVQKIVSQP